MKGILIALCLLLSGAVQAQYAPQAGVVGTTAIPKTSSLFQAWATRCDVQRGLQQIGNMAGGYASLGDTSAAIGAPDGNVLSLGDAGVATVFFKDALRNGTGADFAVFENGFANVLNPEEAFLELAFVEVSSDGVHFTRFPAISQTQDTVQLSSTAAPSYTTARQLHNLAGKYIAGFGTPFDLQELVDSPGLDVQHIIAVRLIDVVGAIGADGSLDAQGRKVNDPFPTPFPSSGFDLDAVGVIHSTATTVVPTLATDISVYPNPAGATLDVRVPDGFGTGLLSLYAPSGACLRQNAIHSGTTRLSLQELPAGLLFLRLQFQNGYSCTKLLLHQ
ncbi:MAG: T9SS type A sorting domain-containing protein [Bacteroidetes bacterium]|nr:T9SS type A sorting domain-containing protein [Bacteroidota bacterium]